MQFIRNCNVNEIAQHSLLHHSKDVSDYCKCYAIQLRKGQDKIKDVTEKIQSLYQGQINTSNKKGKGFINIKPFLFTENETIYGFNARYMECRFSILINNVNKSHFHLLILINYTSKLSKYIFWPAGLAVRAYLIFNINKAIRHSK